MTRDALGVLASVTGHRVDYLRAVFILSAAQLFELSVDRRQRAISLSAVLLAC